jgi:hypothetical protein
MYLSICSKHYSQEGQVVSDVSAHRVVHVTAEPAEVHPLDELAGHLQTHPIIYHGTRAMGLQTSMVW